MVIHLDKSISFALPFAGDRVNSFRLTNNFGLFDSTLLALELIILPPLYVLELLDRREGIIKIRHRCIGKFVSTESTSLALPDFSIEGFDGIQCQSFEHLFCREGRDLPHTETCL